MTKNIIANNNGEEQELVVNGEPFAATEIQSDNLNDCETLNPAIASDIPKDLPNPANDNAEAPKTPNDGAAIPDFQTPEVVVDIEGIAAKSGIPASDLIPMFSASQAVAIPLEIGELKSFITVQDGIANTAAALSKNMCLPAEQRELFLKKAQLFAGLCLKGQAQLGNAIRQIRTQKGYRSDLKKGKVDFDEVLTEVRTKTQILKDDYNLGKGEARDLARLTDALVDEEIEYAIKHHDIFIEEKTVAIVIFKLENVLSHI